MDRMKQLVEILNKYAYEYYVLDTPTVSDKEYDALYDELVALEKQANVVLPDSPTKEWADNLLKILLRIRIFTDYTALINAIRLTNCARGTRKSKRISRTAFILSNTSLTDLLCVLRIATAYFPARRREATEKWART